MSSKVYKGFINHAWEYNPDYYILESKLETHPNFIWRNYAVPKYDFSDRPTDQELIERLVRQIKSADHVLIISDIYSENRKWGQIEIEIARSMNIPIIGIKPKVRERAKSMVKESAIVMLDWKISGIVNAIKSYAGEFEYI